MLGEAVGSAADMAQKEHLVRRPCLKLINLGIPSTNFKVGVWFLGKKRHGHGRAGRASSYGLAIDLPTLSAAL